MFRPLSLAALFVSALSLGCASHNHKMHKDDEGCGCSDVEDAHHDDDKADGMKHDKHHDEKDEGDKDEKSAELPADATAAFMKAHPGAKITSVEKEMEDGKVEYEVKYSDASGDHEIDLNAQGLPADEK